MKPGQSGASNDELSVCMAQAHKPNYIGTLARSLSVLVLAAGFLAGGEAYSKNPIAGENGDGEDNASETGIDKGTSNGVANGLNGGSSFPLPNSGNGNGDGNGNQYCQILIQDQGALGNSIENLALSSKLMGGRAGTAQVTATNGSYTLSVDQPLGFTSAPSGASGAMIMSASYIGHGDTNFTETPGGVSVRLGNGTTTVQAHLSAERTDGNPFPAGYYTAELTLRCE